MNATEKEKADMNTTVTTNQRLVTILLVLLIVLVILLIISVTGVFAMTSGGMMGGMMNGGMMGQMMGMSGQAMNDMITACTTMMQNHQGH